MEKIFSIKCILKVTINPRNRIIFISRPIISSEQETQEKILKMMNDLNWKTTGIPSITTIHETPAITVGFSIPLFCSMDTALKILSNHLEKYGWNELE